MGIVVEIVKQVSQSVSLNQKNDQKPEDDSNLSKCEEPYDKSQFELNYCFSPVILIDILGSHIIDRYPIFLPFVLK